ncbi:ABC transporter permease [Halostagnicola kamekurae]|uniref:Spermidine/putrescine transport system permease protein n=1 Tax=Halostagnicola kamekurae TaxID=619731 RepID=A0A1I6QAY5_9EURY|nr:ABC transporter permease [Halostagnicola kamekurae]SFS49594.1 spermidine/putrescine transport system permease protein [Halostagnicola kamekurae]
MSGNSNAATSGVIERFWKPLVARSRSKRALLLMAPLVIFELLIFVAPFLILLRISVSEAGERGTAYAEGTWSTDAYTNVLTSEVPREVIAHSFTIGLVATAIAVVVGLLYAYAIWRAEGFAKSLLLFSVILPLLTTLVVKTYAFRPLLSPTGTLNNLLESIGLLSTPLEIVPGLAGAIVGQVYIVLPYAVLAIYSVLATMDWQLVEAARDLGASRPRSVLEVVVPQAMPGIIVATVISFAWSVGSYAAPFLLGDNVTFAMRVEGQILRDFQWPTATALSVVMIAAMLVVIGAIVAVLSRFGGEMEYA